MLRKPAKGKSLAEVNPKLSEEWHPTKNGVLRPSDFNPGSDKKVWWKCDVAPDHEWEARIEKRSKGQGCPCCSGRKVVKSNSLGFKNPNLASEVYDKDIDIYSIYAGGNKKITWQCSLNKEHIWTTAISKRISGTGCPYCSGAKVSSLNSLGHKFPELLDEWDYEKNSIIPSDVSFGSKKKVWWKCQKNSNHKYLASIAARTSGNRTGCPYCAGKLVLKEESFAALHPNLLKNWDYNKNKISPYEILSSTDKKFFWICDNGHSFQVQPLTRIKGHTCSVCSGKKVIPSTSVKHLYPNLLSEWDFKKNKENPNEVHPGSNKKYWWICSANSNHKWETRLIDRTRNGLGCPYCSNQKTNFTNSLQSLFPKLSKEWHLEKNKKDPGSINPGTHLKAWWICSKNKDHIWKTKVYLRAYKGYGCPFCTLTPQSRQELVITFELKQFFEIDPKGFKTHFNGKLWSIDIYIEELELGVEFDGAYWHKGKRELDKLKTEQIEDQGFKILRIREEPLKKIFESDIISPKPYNGKYLTNQVLKYIMSNYSLDSDRVNAIKSYLKKRKLQNETQLDSYIEEVLLEKAERKRNRKKMNK